MFLIGEVCGASRKASSNNEPTEVSRCHSRQRLKARGRRRRATLNHTSKTFIYPMKGEKPKTSESCPRKNSSESERYEGAPTLIGIVGDELVDVQLSSDRMLEYILTPDNLNRAYKQVKANKGSGGIDRMEVEQLLPYLREHKEEITPDFINAPPKLGLSVS